MIFNGILRLQDLCSCKRLRRKDNTDLNVGIRIGPKIVVAEEDVDFFEKKNLDL